MAEKDNIYFFHFLLKFGAAFVLHALFSFVLSLLLPLLSSMQSILSLELKTMRCCIMLRGQDEGNKYWRCEEHHCILTFKSSQ